MATVGPDSARPPLGVDDLDLLPSIKSSRARCDEVIGGRRASVTTYFERGSALLPGRYVAAAAIELTPGGWLQLGTASTDAEGQRRMLAVLRSVRFLPPVGAPARRTPPPCPSANVDTGGWVEHAVQSAPATFQAPQDSRPRPGYGTEVWDVAGLRLDFVPLATAGWALEPSELPGSQWCSLSVAGQPGEILVAPMEPHGHLPAGYFYAMAYVQLDTGRVLHVFGYIIGDTTAPGRFRAVISSLRQRR